MTISSCNKTRMCTEWYCRFARVCLPAQHPLQPITSLQHCFTFFFIKKMSIHFTYLKLYFWFTSSDVVSANTSARCLSGRLRIWSRVSSSKFRSLCNLIHIQLQIIWNIRNVCEKNALVTLKCYATQIPDVFCLAASKRISEKFYCLLQYETTDLQLHSLKTKQELTLYTV